MAAITIKISDARLEGLKQLAEQHGVSSEELLTSSVENWLGDDEGSFAQSANYVLKKNAELYRYAALFSTFVCCKVRLKFKPI